MSKVWICWVIMILCMVYLAGCEGNRRVALLTNEATSQVEGRLGTRVGETWEVGALSRWYSEDVGGADWGGGAYLTMDVDPNGTIAVADWFPQLGDLLNLPESLSVSTYAIGKLLYVDRDTGDPLGGAVGAGFGAGPAMLEVTYNLVESGQSEDPVERSGIEVWFGAGLPF